MVRQNVLANYAGQACVGILSVAFVPLYVDKLGISAYGLIGVFAILQNAMGVLDLGMTPALNREMARSSIGAFDGQTLRDLLRSLEGVYATFSLVLLGAFWLLVPWLAEHWLTHAGVALDTVRRSLNLMALVVILRAWELIYRGAIQGLQRQVWLNVAQSILALLRWAGALGVLIWISPTIEAFFVWQGIVSLLTVAVLARKTYSHLAPTARAGHFSFSALQSIWRFTSGLAVATVASLILTQADKVLLSKWLPLSAFGYYTLAVTLSNLLPLIIYPMNNAVYPKLSELVAIGDTRAVAATYLKGSQWLSVFLIPPAVLMAYFATTVLQLWTGDLTLAHRVAPIVRFLVLGNLFYGFSCFPKLLQLSYGWTSLGVAIYVVALFLYLPTLVFAIDIWGALGAAGGWLVFNVCYASASVYFMHCRLLPDVRWPWIRDAILWPLLPVIAMGWLSAWLLPSGVSKLEAAGWIMASGMLAVLVAASAAPVPRKFLRQRLESLCRAGTSAARQSRKSR